MNTDCTADRRQSTSRRQNANRSIPHSLAVTPPSLLPSVCCTPIPFLHPYTHPHTCCIPIHQSHSRHHNLTSLPYHTIQRITHAPPIPPSMFIPSQPLPPPTTCLGGAHLSVWMRGISYHLCLSYSIFLARTLWCE